MSAEPSGSNPRSRPEPMEAPLSEVALGEGAILAPPPEEEEEEPKRLWALALFRPPLTLKCPTPCCRSPSCFSRKVDSSSPRSEPGTGGRGTRATPPHARTHVCAFWSRCPAVQTAEVILLVEMLADLHRSALVDDQPLEKKILPVREGGGGEGFGTGSSAGKPTSRWLLADP